LVGVLPFRLIPFRLLFTVSFRVTVCLGLGIGLGSGLCEVGLGEMGQNLVVLFCVFGVFSPVSVPVQVIADIMELYVSLFWLIGWCVKRIIMLYKALDSLTPALAECIYCIACRHV